MSTHLTGKGSEGMAFAVFEQAEIALFDGQRQVTEWQPYDVRENTAITVPEQLADAVVELRTPDGTWGRWPARTLVLPGDTLAPPPPSEWFVSDAS